MAKGDNQKCNKERNKPKVEQGQARGEGGADRRNQIC